MTDEGARELVGVREASLVLGLSADLASIGAARRRIGAFLELSALDEEDAESMLLVTSELCTNAVQAAPEEAEVLVGCRFSARAVEVQVINPGSGFGKPRRGMPPPEAESGRGLAIVETLTDQLQIRQRSGRTTVRAVRRLSPDHGSDQRDMGPRHVMSAAGGRRAVTEGEGSGASAPSTPRFRRRW